MRAHRRIKVVISKRMNLPSLRPFWGWLVKGPFIFVLGSCNRMKVAISNDLATCAVETVWVCYCLCPHFYRYRCNDFRASILTSPVIDFRLIVCVRACLHACMHVCVCVYAYVCVLNITRLLRKSFKKTMIHSGVYKIWNKDLDPPYHGQRLNSVGSWFLIEVT